MCDHDELDPLIGKLAYNILSDSDDPGFRFTVRVAPSIYLATDSDGNEVILALEQLHDYFIESDAETEVIRKRLERG